MTAPGRGGVIGFIVGCFARAAAGGQQEKNGEQKGDQPDRFSHNAFLLLVFCPQFSADAAEGQGTADIL
jgi:hypothetical protein